MKLLLFHLVVFLASVRVQGIKKCTKIDACRCSTDEGEINLWRLAGENAKDRPRFNIPEAIVANITGQTKDSYQWNPCDSWTAKRLPNETAENGCKDVAVCKIQKIHELGTFHVNIGEQKLSDCVLDQQNGRCLLTYRVTTNKQIKTTIALVCNETEEGRVDAMISSFPNLYSTSLHSKCACPGRCSSLSTGAIVGIVIGSVAGFLFLPFVVFICCLRCKLPDGVPKPSMCTTIKDGFELIIAECCPCCKRLQYTPIA
ncbi:hypothetical protein OS493_023432 [Desmophyllum pertusum]|uniref:Uncharacterized protein n=1 Tax=Desmophyllum pertusum TaxID=174260 RepID=A0A9W9ZLV3_9CNID|nr:hypothetical protein OS493_023432 [Desmophyllum pertusum]